MGSTRWDNGANSNIFCSISKKCVSDTSEISPVMHRKQTCNTTSSDVINRSHFGAVSAALTPYFGAANQPLEPDTCSHISECKYFSLRRPLKSSPSRGPAKTWWSMSGPSQMTFEFTHVYCWSNKVVSFTHSVTLSWSSCTMINDVNICRRVCMFIHNTSEDKIKLLLFVFPQTVQSFFISVTFSYGTLLRDIFVVQWGFPWTLIFQLQCLKCKLHKFSTHSFYYRKELLWWQFCFQHNLGVQAM